MSSLWRKSLRDLVVNRWQVAGLALLVAVVVTLMAGAGRGHGMLSASRADLRARLHAPDLDVRCSPTLPGVLEEARKLPGIAVAEERMLLDGVMRAPGVQATPAVVRMLPERQRPRLSRLEVVAGRWPEPGEEALLVDRSIAKCHGVRPGDRVGLEIRGTLREVPVVGVVLDPEYGLHPAHPDFEIPIPGAYAPLYLSHAASKHFEYADRVDSLLFAFADGADPAETARALRETLPVAILAMIGPDDNSAARVGRMVLDIFDVYVPTVAIVLIGVALALFVMTVARIVRRQGTQVGTLLTLGHRPLPIALSMLGVSIVPTVAGGLLGAAVHPLVARRIFDAHAEALGWAPLVDPGPGPEVLHTVLACAGVAVLACLVPGLGSARKLPARLLREGTWDGVRHARGWLGHLGAHLRSLLHLPLYVVLGLTTVLRRRWATTTAALALAANFAVVMAFLFVHVSHQREVQATFDRLGLDGVAYFDVPQADEGVAALARPDWTEVQPLISRIAWMEFPSGPSFMRITCLQPDGWIRRFAIAAGHPFSGPDADEIYVDHWTADRYGLAVGDRFPCYAHYSAPESLELTVAAILDGVSIGLCVIPLETGRRLYELPGMATGVHVASDAPRATFVEALRALPSVTSVVYLPDARNHVVLTFEAARFIVMLALGLAVVVAAIFLGILASLDASERARDLAILRSLGWRDRRVLGLCVTEVASRGYLALVLALPLAPVMGRWILGRVEEANRYRMPMHDPAWVYLGVFALAAILIPLGAIPAWRAAASMPAQRIARLLSRE